jgi:hypothetical protein
MNIIWGYWQMTPNVQFGGGYWDSLAAVQAGWDWSGETALVGLTSGITNDSESQFRLTYNSGGLTLAASLEDNDNGDIPAIAGTIIFDSGSFVVTASAIWEEDDSTAFADTEDNWFVGAGAIVKMSDMFRLEGAAGMGDGYTKAMTIGQHEDENDLEYWGANVLAVISFAEAMRLELGFAYTDADHEADELLADLAVSVHKSWTAGASLFWDPVDQLTLGWGAAIRSRTTTRRNTMPSSPASAPGSASNRHFVFTKDHRPVSNRGPVSVCSIRCDNSTFPLHPSTPAHS